MLKRFSDTLCVYYKLRFTFGFNNGTQLCKNTLGCKCVLSCWGTPYLYNIKHLYAVNKTRTWPKLRCSRIIVMFLFEERLNPKRPRTLYKYTHTHQHKGSRGVLLTLAWANKRTLVDCCSLRVEFMCRAWYTSTRAKCFVLGFLDTAPTAFWARSFERYYRIVKLNCQTLPLQQIRLTLWDVVVSQRFVFAISLIVILFVTQTECFNCYCLIK